MRKALWICALSAVLCGGLGGSVSAEERTCRGRIGATTVDNLRVPQGATCKLVGTFVKGTILVERGAELRATDIRVIGNIQAEDASFVRVEDSAIGGSVQLVQGGGAEIVDNVIKGSILFDDNNRRLSALRNHIDENLQAFQNTGGVKIVANRIDGNLQCKENKPAPTGGRNVVQGEKEDQCAKL